MKIKREAYTLIPGDHRLPPYGNFAGDSNWAENAVALIRLFDPFGTWEWYLYEYDPENSIAMAFVAGAECEVGPVYLPGVDELTVGVNTTEIVELPRVIRDLAWKPEPIGAVLDRFGLSWHRK